MRDIDVEEKIGYVAVAEQSSTGFLESKQEYAGLPGFLESTAIIFDWDDTLFASSAMSAHGMNNDDKEELTCETQGMLIELENSMMSLLEKAVQLGKVIIITNADNGWVNLCGERYYPRGLKYIESAGIPIISARHLYESKYPDSPVKWKEEAFADSLSPMCQVDEEINVVVLGDGMSEKFAAHSFSKSRLRSRVKTVKFIDQPTMNELLQQLDLVESCLEYIWEHDGSFDIELGSKKSDELTDESI